MELVEFNGKKYPHFQATGNAAQFAIPFARHFCRGVGYDIGCSREEWALPGAIPIDLSFDDPYHADFLPKKDVDYIFSSHCLEHVIDWVATMNYWDGCLKAGGILFLYLPHYSQEYWRPWNNPKHKHVLSPELIKDFLLEKGYINIFSSGCDLNNSFMVVAQK